MILLLQLLPRHRVKYFGFVFILMSKDKNKNNRPIMRLILPLAVDEFYGYYYESYIDLLIVGYNFTTFLR